MPAANSALQRARQTMRRRLPERRSDWTRGADRDRREQALLERYMGLMEDNDVDGLVEVLSEDARIAMPPFPAWYEGREAVGEFHRRHAWAAGDWRAVAVRANGHPACACYLRERPEEPFRAFAIDVLRIEDGRIAEIMAFIAPELYPAFGLPETL